MGNLEKMIKLKPVVIQGVLLLLTASFGSGAIAADGDLLRSGYASFAFGQRDCTNSDDVKCGNHNAYALDAHMSLPVGYGMAVQGDLQTEQYVGAQEASAQSMQATTLGGHFSWRNSKWFLVGAYAGLAQHGIRDNDSGANGFRWGKIFGTEAQAYLWRFTLYGQLGRSVIHEGDNYFNASYYRTVARFYPIDNLLIQAETSRGTSKRGYEDAGDWGTARNSAFEVKMQVSRSTPLSVFVRHEFGTYRANTEDSGKEHVTLVGVAYAFGGATSLFEQDRRGATLDLPMLPSRAGSWAAVLD